MKKGLILSALMPFMAACAGPQDSPTRVGDYPSAAQDLSNHLLSAYDYYDLSYRLRDPELRDNFEKEVVQALLKDRGNRPFLAPQDTDYYSRLLERDVRISVYSAHANSLGYRVGVVRDNKIVYFHGGDHNMVSYQGNSWNGKMKDMYQTLRKF
jgi:hypothetical protein